MLRKSYFVLLVLLTISAIAFAQPDTLVTADSIAGPATWGNNWTWIINNLNDEVRLTSGTLTIQAGTTVKFAADNSLIIDGGAILTAEGASASPITFTSNAVTPGAGEWGSIKFDGSDVDTIATGEFKHCLFEYGGDAFTELKFQSCSARFFVVLPLRLLHSAVGFLTENDSSSSNLDRTHDQRLHLPV